MLLIGLTGGIASGKTLVSDAFVKLNVAVVDADVMAREVVAPNSDGLSALVTYFTNSILTPTGELDRKALRERIFKNPPDREMVDQILHPLIRKRSEFKIAHYRDAGEPYVIYAVPLLVETNQESRFDRILLVDVPVELQLKRILSRDNTTREQAHAIIDAQASREARQAIATDTIINDGSIEDVRQQVNILHNKYLNLAQGN